MPKDPAITVNVDLNRVRANAISIGRLVGRGVDVLAVVKADAYGLGIDAVAPAIADVVQGFCVFSYAEACKARLWERTRKSTLALAPSDGVEPADLLAQHVRPAVSSVSEARRLQSASPALCIDLGMQRFACPLDQVDAAIEAGECAEAFVHAVHLRQVNQLKQIAGHRGLRLHAAGSALLAEPSARLDAVRPGIALYRGVVRVVARLVEARDSGRPAGYTGFVTPRLGVILGGYSQRLRPGVCRINGSARRILEVGMQSAFVELGPDDQVGDEVLLLGDGLSEAEVAAAWQTTEQQALLQLAGSGEKRYLPLKT